jgi:PEP-CTERM motif
VYSFSGVEMRNFFFSLLVGVAALAVVPHEAKAIVAITATETFSFSGTCSDCSGFGTGTLTLQNYTPGNGLSTVNFVSFEYSSNLVGPIDLTSADIFNGSIGSAPGSYEVFIDSESAHFTLQTFVNGTWCVDAIEGCSTPADFGSEYTWTEQVAAVPEPSTWAMMILGFCGLGFMAYRRKQSGSALSVA